MTQNMRTYRSTEPRSYGDGSMMGSCSKALLKEFGKKIYRLCQEYGKNMGRVCLDYASGMRYALRFAAVLLMMMVGAQSAWG